LNYFAYAYLWLSLIISTAVYAVDTFTAVNLLAFNKWSGEIKPYIPFDISKWVFSACIIASWVNLGLSREAQWQRVFWIHWQSDSRVSDSGKQEDGDDFWSSQS
jgi:hypothetical protein